MKNKLITALLSVLIAIGIWLYVVTVVSPNSDKHFYNVPVVTQSEAILQDRGLMITDTDISAVSLHLEGSRLDLNKLSSSNISVTVDVSRIGEVGEHSLTYSVTYPGDVAQNAITVLSKSPDTVTVTVQERITKDVPVQINYSGNLAENFVADKENKTLDYQQVNITGPKSVIDKIASAQINVDLEGRSESFSEQYAFTLCDDQGAPVDAKLVTTDVAKVSLTLQIIRIKEIQLNVTVVDGGGATAQTSYIDVQPKTIRISGSDSLLEGLDTLELGTIDLGEILKDDTLTFPIKLPEGITNETGVTEAKVEVRFPELATKTLKITNIKAVNVPAGMQAELITQALEVQLRGPKDKIEALTAENVTVTVDFKDAQTGSVKIKAQILCTDPAVGAVGSYTVSATVTED